MWTWTAPRNPSRLETTNLDLVRREWRDGRNGLDAMDWRREPRVLIVLPGHHWTKRASVNKSELAGGRNDGRATTTLREVPLGDRCAGRRRSGEKV